MSQHGSMADQTAAAKERMGHVAHKIIVLSGKGGVGKSTVAVNLAVSLALEGKRVGLLDIDLHGPTVPQLLGLRGQSMLTEAGVVLPIDVGDNIKVMSIDFWIADQDGPVVWRGPMKAEIIQQFLSNVEWGELDYLIIDSPPGTGDEPLTVVQTIGDLDGAVIVTTPQETALSNVRRSINFCRLLELPVLGVVENMSGFVCPHCGEVTDVFGKGGGETMARKFGVPFLGRIPLEPQMAEAGDAGAPYMYHYSKTRAAAEFRKIIVPILELDNEDGRHDDKSRPAHSENA